MCVSGLAIILFARAEARTMQYKYLSSGADPGRAGPGRGGSTEGKSRGPGRGGAKEGRGRAKEGRGQGGWVRGQAGAVPGRVGGAMKEVAAMQGSPPPPPISLWTIHPIAMQPTTY